MIVGVFTLPQTVIVCYMQATTHVALMVTLACFVLLRALYTLHFEFMNRVRDITIVRIIQAASLIISITVHIIEILYKVYSWCFFPNENKLYFFQYKNGLFLLSKLNMYLFLGGPKVESQRSNGFIGG